MKAVAQSAQCCRGQLAQRVKARIRGNVYASLFQNVAYAQFFFTGRYTVLLLV